MKAVLVKMKVGIFIVPVFLLLIFGVIYENSYGDRKFLLISLGVICGVLVLGIHFFVDKKAGIVAALVLMMGLVVLEVKSKYAINYFFHCIYFFEVVYVILYFKGKYSLVVSGGFVGASMVKFIDLVATQGTSANISLSLFFGIISILVFVVVFLAKTYREESRKTKKLYNELFEAHRRLKNYSKDMQTLASYEERTRIARDLHDTLGHEMTGLIMQMEMASSFFKNGSEDEAEKLLEESKKSAREALTKVREIVNTLKSEENELWTNKSIRELIQNFSAKTKVKIIANIDEKEYSGPDIGVTVYRVIQEALTNAVRHGKAENIEVMVKCEENFIKVVVKDDGLGCREIVQGNGLKGMRQRVEKLKGSLNIMNGTGITIFAKIPNHE